MKKFSIGVIALVVIVLSGIWIGSCQKQAEDYRTHTNSQTTIKLVKVEFTDGHIEVHPYEYVWHTGEREAAMINIDYGKTDIYIKLKDIKRYTQYRGYKSEITKQEATR